MDKQQAYYNFWNGFGVLAFEENSVPTEDEITAMIKAGLAKARWPMITYQVLIDDLGYPVYPSASIYDKSSSWQRADTLSNAISARIQSQKTIKLDNGRMFITKGSPFAQHMEDASDRSIRRIIINTGIEFFTEE